MMVYQLKEGSSYLTVYYVKSTHDNLLHLESRLSTNLQYPIIRFSPSQKQKSKNKSLDVTIKGLSQAYNLFFVIFTHSCL